MKQPEASRTWIEIDLGAIEKNAAVLKALVGASANVMAVVKSNAYGHGMVESARAALRGGATWLGVDELSEALELRKARIKAPILVLGYTLPTLYKTAAEKDVSLTISSLESLQALSRAKLPKAKANMLRIHVKFDTGLHRQGILETYVQQAVRLLTAKGFPAVVEGVYTHFAAMEDPMHREYSEAQARSFRAIVAKIREKGLKPITHSSASSGILFSKDFHFDMARAGIALYGLWPSREIKKWAESVGGEAYVPKLAPALSWKAIVSEVKLIPKGAKVGYDLTFEAKRPSRIAVIPVGYWHGLPRSLSNKGQVAIRGARASIIGRISMDMTILDVTDIPSVREGDEATIIGAGMGVEQVAERAGTINYELVTRINPLIPRIS
ncbi:MAG TPA: alanine racemase [Candidatus Paceibacterota bacterium]|nr:alanine racemase [Candidatus Paceibacterota bacterium]